MTDQKPMEFSDINSDGPELSCQYIDGVIKRFPESKPTMEYIRTINAQLRHDRDGYAEMYKELRAENERLKESVEQLANFDEKEFKRQWGIRRVGMVMDHGSVNGAMCFHHWFVTPVIKALRGADEKD